MVARYVFLSSFFLFALTANALEITSFFAHPAPVTEGESTNFYWTSDEASFCQIVLESGHGETSTPLLPPNGQFPLTLTDDTSAVLTCLAKGKEEPVQASITIEVSKKSFYADVLREGFDVAHFLNHAFYDWVVKPSISLGVVNVLKPFFQGLGRLANHLGPKQKTT